jgi:hypothetical protein
MWFALPRRHFRCDNSLHWHWYFDDRSIGGIRCAPLNHKRTNDAFLNRQYAQLTEACKKVVDLQKK